jgi:ornithine carrier protein
MAAGMVAGFCVATVLTPVELVKVKLQFELQQMTHNKDYKPQFKGPIDCIRKTLAREGLGRGLFKGYVATLAREMPGNAAWFGTYETLCMVG